MGEATDDLRRGRSAYAQNAWRDAYASLAAADRLAGLEVDDLEFLAMSALLSGKMSEGQAGMERIHQAHLERGNPSMRHASRFSWE